MSTYYYIGCEKCRESTAFMSDGMSGFGWMGGAIEEVPEFVEKHLREGCDEHLRIFSEHDRRSEDFAEFRPMAKLEGVEPSVDTGRQNDGVL